MSGFIFYFSMIKYENYKINENVKGLKILSTNLSVNKFLFM